MSRHQSSLRPWIVFFGAVVWFLSLAVASGFCAAKSYRVRSGDSLWKIAERFLGDGLLWRKLYRKNAGAISNPRLIRPGQTLSIPGPAKAPKSSHEKEGRGTVRVVSVAVDALSALSAAPSDASAHPTAEKAKARKARSPKEKGAATPGARGCDKALQWALHGSMRYRNPNNGQVGRHAWGGYCLAHVRRAWEVGARRSISLLVAGSAKDSLKKFRKAGRLRPVKGPIPKGAPVFWGNGTYGHVAIATGKTDRHGEPLVCSTSSDRSLGGIFVRPLSFFTKCNGRPAGWGFIHGTPVA